MKKLAPLFLILSALLVTPVQASSRKPLVLSSTGTTQQIQAGDGLQLPASTTPGASLNVPHGVAPLVPVDGDIWTTTAGTFTRINGVTVGPLVGLNSSPIWTARQKTEFALTGSLTSNFNYLFNPQALGIWSTSDNQSSGTTGTNIPSLVSIEQYFGGSNVDDGRNSLGVAMHMTAPTKSTNPYRFYAAGNFVADSAFNDGGTGGSPQGTLYGLGGVCRLKTGATNWKGCIAGDFELSVEAGANALVVTPMALLTWPEHATHGSLVDAGLWISAASSTGFFNGIQIDASAGYYPVDSTGTIFKSNGGTVSNGIDFSGTTISNWLLRGGGIIETTSTATSTSTTTGAVRIAGGVGIAGAVNVGGIVKAQSATASTSTSTGGLVVTGGLGVGGAGYFGGTVTAPTFSGNLTGAVTGNVSGNLTGNVTGNVTGAVNGSIGATTPSTGTFTTVISNSVSTGSTALTAYTVSTLPTCNSSTNGALYYITDATAPTYNGTLTGGGSVRTLALCNNTAWTAH